MHKILNVMVMGAGAVGGYFGARIAQHTSVDVTFIARGKHLQVMQQKGLRLKSVDGDTTIQAQSYENPSDAPPPDFILFTVKSFDTEAAINAITPAVGEHTQILTIQNGIENYAKLTDAFGRHRVIQGFCKIGAGIAAPGVISHKALGEITVGEQDGTTSERLKTLQKIAEKAKIPFHISADINREVWLKFAWNSIFNMITAAANITVEKVFTDTSTRQLCYDIFAEIRSVAAAEGVELTAEDGENMIEPARKLTGFTTSTYQDRQKGKPMEYEAFTGAIVRLARKHHIKVPHNETIYALLKLIDTND